MEPIHPCKKVVNNYKHRSGLGGLVRVPEPREAEDLSKTSACRYKKEVGVLIKKKSLKLMILAATMLLTGPLVGKGKPGVQEQLPILTPNTYDMMVKTPVPAWDTNRVWSGASTIRKVAIGTNFKGAMDDTIRIVTVQSIGTRYLVMATDTTSTGFGKEKFRIDTPYAFSGGTPHAVAVGDVDGDEYIDIVAAMSASPRRVIWFEWDGANWAARDSFAVNAGIYDLAIGDANNDGNANEILIPLNSSTPSPAIIRAVWTGAAWDTTRIEFSPITTAYQRGVAIGDVRSDLPGNEIYVASGTVLWSAHWNGVSWDTMHITTAVAGAYDVVVGDINPTLPGNEIAVVHGASSYQISVWNWDGLEWQGNAYQFTTSPYTGPNDIAIGDVLTDNPGNEVIVTSASTTQYPVAFWIAQDGSAWVSTLPKPVSGTADYGVAIGDINRFRNLNQEFVITGGGSLVEGEQRDFVNDIGTYWVTKKNPTSIKNLPDTVKVAIFNSGSNAQTGFTVGYRFKTSPLTGSVTYTGSLASGAVDSVKIPVTMDFLGWDTLYAFTNLAGDANVLNDTTCFGHIEVYDESTKAASGFNSTVFPPDEWTRTILVGTYNWARYTSGTSPTCTPLEGAGMAGYPSYSASSGQQARLRTHKFNIGPSAKKVMLRFYMYGDPDYATEPDSIIVEYSDNDTTYAPVGAFHRYNAVAGWYVHDVEIGDFPSGKELYVGFRAISGYGNNMFIDSVRVFVTEPTAVATDAGIQSITPFPVPHFVGDSLDVTVTINNYGLNLLTSTPVFYTLGAADTVFEAWAGSLQTGQTDDYTFAQKFVPAQSGDDTLCAGTRLPGDQNADNDTTNLAFATCPLVNVPPYTKDFDEEWTNSTNPPFCGWTIIDGGTQSPPIVDYNDWHRFESATPARIVARVYYSPIETHDDWLISPRFDCSAIGYYTLSYWHWYRDYSAASLDSGRVLISTDGGANWQTVAMYSNATDSGYKYHDISALVMGQSNVKVAFHYVAENEYWWYFDDFALDYAPDTIGPEISYVEQPENTYLGGPYVVRALLSDIAGILADSLYYIVNDVVTAIGHTAVSGDTFSYQIPTQAPGTVIEYYVGAVDNLMNSSTSARHSFWVLSPMAPSDLEVEGQADSTVWLGWLPPGEELSYHGAVAYYWHGWLVDDMIATQFTPQHTPCKLEAVSCPFYLHMDTVLVSVWDDDGAGNPGSVLHAETLIITQLYPNAMVIDLSAEDIVIDSDFHVGLVWLHADKPYPLSDSGANTTRSKYNDGTGWQLFGYDWVMSAVVRYLAPVPDYVSSRVKVDKFALFETPKPALAKVTGFSSVPKRLAKHEIGRGEIGRA
ncbi:choice-of-anchor J domain-containing protein, partial [candidate division WOR-3 bacterium]|nr:choice-of-anchor J domain-containing protein [candidate division WOR-3 bacterium]